MSLSIAILLIYINDKLPFYRKETGESSYPIVVGGSSDYGAYAYIDVLNELLDQVRWTPHKYVKWIKAIIRV